MSTIGLHLGIQTWEKMKNLYSESEKEDEESVPAASIGPSNEGAAAEPNQEKEAALTAEIVASRAEEGVVEDVVE